MAPVATVYIVMVETAATSSNWEGWQRRCQGACQLARQPLYAERCSVELRHLASRLHRCMLRPHGLQLCIRYKRTRAAACSICASMPLPPCAPAAPPLIAAIAAAAT